MAIKFVKTITITNIGKGPIQIIIAESKRNSFFNRSGMITIMVGHVITVEIERVDLSHIENLRKLGAIKRQIKNSEVVLPDSDIGSEPAEEEPEELNLSFTYAIGGGPQSIDPDDIITGLTPSTLTSSAITVTNNGSDPVDVETAVLSPGSDATITGFSSSTLNNGQVNSFNLTWGAASPFDEDLTITVNGTDFVFTFQGTIIGEDL